MKIFALRWLRNWRLYFSRILRPRRAPAPDRKKRRTIAFLEMP